MAKPFFYVMAVEWWGLPYLLFTARNPLAYITNRSARLHHQSRYLPARFDIITNRLHIKSYNVAKPSTPSSVL